MSRRRFASRLAQFVLCSSLAAFAGPAPVREAPPAPRTGAAAALRVGALAERILKLHAQAGQRILAPRARRALGMALRDLDAAVHALGMPPAPSELHERVAILALLAGQYRAWALKPPGREVALALAERAEEIEWEAAHVAALVEAARGSPRAPASSAIEASGNAQRIARLLLWQRWGIAGPSGANELALAKAALQAGLEALRKAPRSTAAMEAELQVAENQAAFLFAASWRLDAGEAGARQLEFAVKAADNAAESLERLAALHERAAR